MTHAPSQALRRKLIRLLSLAGTGLPVSSLAQSAPAPTRATSAQSVATATSGPKPSAAAHAATTPDTSAADFPPVVPGVELQFPRDFGAHPSFRTEWWYLTSAVDTPTGPLGVQLTFFRSRTPYGRTNPSRFAPRQLMFAHAAIADPAHGRLLHAEQAWREDPVLARSREGDTDVRIGPPHRRWQLQRDRQDIYQAAITDPAFRLQLSARPRSKPVLQGEAGFSRKGLDDLQASYYYSRPQLQIAGRLERPEQAPLTFTGTGWLDHEWSSELLDPQAEGWDWVGLNFADGSALMAFQMRADDGPPLRRTARLVDANGTGHDVPVQFSTVRQWESPHTGARYPVSVRLQAGPLDLLLVPLLDDQELDSRRSTGTVYWEGAMRVYSWSTAAAQAAGQPQKSPDTPVVGQGYLEMTGYAAPIKF